MRRIWMVWAALFSALGCQNQQGRSDRSTADNGSAAVVADRTVTDRTVADQSRTVRATPLPNLPEHAGHVNDVAFSADGRRFASIGQDLHVKICDARTGRLVHDLQVGPPPQSIHPTTVALAFAPEGTLLAVGVDKAIHWYDAESGQLQKQLGHDGFESFSRLRFTTDGRRLVSAGGKKLGVWSVPDGELQMSIDVGGTDADRFALTPDGRLAACPGHERTVELIDLETGQVAHRFSGTHDGNVNSTAVNRRGTLLAAADNGRIVVYDLTTKTERLRADYSYAAELAFSPDGLLAVGGDTIDLFFVGDKELVPAGKCRLRHIGHAHALAFSPDGKQLATEKGLQHRAEVFAVEWSQEERTLLTSEGVPSALAASYDGKLLAIADVRTLKLIAAADGKELAAVSLGDGSVDDHRPLEFAPDGTRLLVRMGDKQTVKLYRVPSLEPERKWSCKSCSDACFTPAGDEVLLVKEGKIIRQSIAAEAVSEAAGTGAGLLRVQFAARGDKLVGHGSQRLEAFAWPDASRLHGFNIGRTIGTIAVSPDGARAVAPVTDRGPLRVWELATSETAAEIDADPHAVRQAAFSADGRLLLTAGDDGRLKAWSTKTWRLEGSCPWLPEGEDTRDLLLATVKGSPKFFTYARTGRGKASLREWDSAKLLARLTPPAPPAVEQAASLLAVPPPLVSTPAPDGWMRGADFLDAGRATYFVDENDQLIVFDLVEGKERFRFDLGDAEWVQFSPDGRWFAASYGANPERAGNAAAEPGTVKIWDAATRKLQRTIDLSKFAPEQICFSPDGRKLAVAACDWRDTKAAEISLWDVATGRRTETLPLEPKKRVHQLGYSPDGALLVASDHADDELIAWDLAAKKVRYRRKFEHDVNDFQFSADGRWFVVACGNRGSNEGSLTLLDPKTGEQRPMFAGFNDEASAIAFGYKYDYLVVVCSFDRIDDGLRYYNLKTGENIRNVPFEGQMIGRGVVRLGPKIEYLAVNAGGNYQVWRHFHLSNLGLLEMIGRVRQRGAVVDYLGNAIRIREHSTRERDVAEMTVFHYPFVLDFRGSDDLTDACLAHLAKQFKLVGLDLTDCSQLTDAAIPHLARLTKLEWLTVRGVKFSAAGREALRKQFAGSSTKIEGL